MQGLSAEVRGGAIPQDTILKFRKGEIIFSQGDPGDCWFEVNPAPFEPVIFTSTGIAS